MTVRNFFGEAREQGKAEGGLNMLVSLVHDGLLRLGDAAKKAGMTEDEFKTKPGCGSRNGPARPEGAPQSAPPLLILKIGRMAGERSGGR